MGKRILNNTELTSHQRLNISASTPLANLANAATVKRIARKSRIK